MKPQLSLCMIVKNEAAHLARCLESVRGLADEIVIVDTGSSDETVAIAESFGARVLHEPWADDFSAARNVSLATATGVWTFVLDADEVLAPADHDGMRRAMQQDDVAGYRMRTRNYVRDGDTADAVRNVDPPPEGKGYPAWIPSDKVRLFRTNPRVRFRGVIHEGVDTSIRDAGGHITALDIPVHHYGFLASDDARRAKRQFHRRLATRKIADQPDDFKAHYELAVIAHRESDFAGARPVLERSIALKGDWAPSHYELGYVCEQLQDWGAAVEAYRRALACDPAHLSAGINLGSLTLRAGLIEESERVLRAVVAHHPDEPRGWNNLGALLGNQKRYDEAEVAWRRALGLEPANPQALENLERLTAQRDTAPAPPRTSLCMIVRDEADNLRAAVEPVRDLVDELVIVDTGSTDATVAIAESLGAHVVHFPWCDDFAAARNYGLDHATGDWILWLDADDRVPDGSLTPLRASLAQPADHAVQWCIESQSGGKEPVRFLQLRQFPRRADVRWQGRIHEEVTSAVRAAGLPVRNVEDITVVHTGYRDSATLRGKHERNLRLLERELADRPDDATLCHHLSQTYALLDRDEDARHVAERIVAMEPLAGDERYLGLQARMRLARFARADGDADGAQALLRQALEIVPHYPPAEYALGELLWKLGETDTAAGHLEHVTRAHMPLSEMPIPLDALQAGAWNVLGRIAQDAGRHADAVGLFRQALTYAPDVDVIHANLATSQKALATMHDADTPAETPTHDAPVLTLCMIVRDEADNLRELLPQITPIADETIVVDTGSGDETAAVAAIWGARVVQHPWADDFAAARNAGLTHAGGQWVLWLDADDRIDPAAFEALKQMLPDMQPQAVRLPVRSAVGSHELTAMSVRLFPTGKGIAWRGRVHEDLVQPCVDAGVPIVDCYDVTIRHEGYADPDALRTKMERNRRLLLLHMAEQPDDVRAELHLAETERYFGELDAAAARLEAVLQRRIEPAMRVQALAFRAQTARDAGDIHAWLRAAGECSNREPGDLVARVGHAEALAAHQRWAEVAIVLEAVAHDAPRPSGVPADLAAVDRRRRLLLGEAYRHAGRQGDTVQELGALLDAEPENRDALMEVANLHGDAGRHAEADAAYAEVLAVDPAHAPALLERGNIAFNRQDFAAAEDLYARALAADPTFRPARENACTVALARGDTATARARLTAALRDYPDAAQLHVYLADLDFCAAQYGPALASYHRYLTADPSDVKAVTRLADCLRLLGHPAESKRAYHTALHLQPDFALAHRGLAALTHA